MTPTRNRLAAMLHAALLASSFFLLPSAVAPAAAEVIPIVITNIVVQKIGPEAELEPLEEGLLYWRPADATTEAGLYYADGETPGGVAVCVGKADYHTLTNTLRCMGHAIELNAHYSLRAEGDSCLLRYGTNIVLRVDGNREAGSTNSLIKATILSADNEGLTIQANALASDGATIEVTTDLMAVEAWTTATNAVVTDTTDVSTTWRITYLDEPYQFYRVFAGASTPHGTGITAERPFTASQGLAIPEGQPLTMGDTTWTNLPDMSTYASNSAVAAVRADLTSLSWRTTTAEGAIDANAAGIATLQGSVATNAGNIATNSTRISAIEADYVQSSALADLATIASVEAVEERVGELEGYHEWPETCRLYWSTNTMSHSGSSTNALYTYFIPTNFPTQKLELYFDDRYATNICVTTPSGWNPGREVEISIIPVHAAAPTNRFTRITIGEGASVSLITSVSMHRNVVFRFQPIHSCWYAVVYNLQTYSRRFTTIGGESSSLRFPIETVEEWIELQRQPATLLSSAPSLQSLRPSLSSSAPLALGADLDASDALDPAGLEDLAPEDFIDEDFTDPDPEDDALDDAEDDALPPLDEEA